MSSEMVTMSKWTIILVYYNLGLIFIVLSLFSISYYNTELTKVLGKSTRQNRDMARQDRRQVSGECT